MFSIPDGVFESILAGINRTGCLAWFEPDQVLQQTRQLKNLVFLKALSRAHQSWPNVHYPELAFDKHTIALFLPEGCCSGAFRKGSFSENTFGR